MPDIFKTKPNLHRKGSEPIDHSNLNATNRSTDNPTDDGSIPVRQISRKKTETEIAPLKDRDWRGGVNEGEMWWECLWEGMDGIKGTNKKGKRCFDKVRILWRTAIE